MLQITVILRGLRGHIIVTESGSRLSVTPQAEGASYESRL